MSPTIITVSISRQLCDELTYEHTIQLKIQTQFNKLFSKENFAQVVFGALTLQINIDTSTTWWKRTLISTA